MSGSYRNVVAQTGFLLAAMMVTLAWPALVRAHPLGDFVVNRYSRLELSVEQIDLYYAVDMAEVPTFQDRQRIDVNDDGVLSEPEKQAYLDRQLETIHSNLSLTVAGTPVALSLQEKTLEFPPGDGGLPTTFITARFSAALPPQEAARQAVYEDNNFANRLGWQEIVVKAGADVTLLASDAPTEELSQGLTAYPEDVIPPENWRAALTFEPQGLSGPESSSVVVSAVGPAADPTLLAKEDTEFAALINTSLTNPTALALVLLAAFGWGAAHALTPGHGKTVVAAYLVGTRGTIKHALFLGLTTTITHTAGVFVLGLITIFAAQYILPEQLFPWLATISGLLVISIGFSMLRDRLAVLLGQAPASHHAHDPHHPHDPDHPHDHDHHHPDHDHPHDHHHDHDHHHHHGHDHGHHHPHHGPGHGGHSHLPPGAEGEPVTWRSLLALGVSGGLVPCPAALLVMLSAIALQRIGFGMVLIVVFSLGLAGVLTAIGVMWVKARDFLNRFDREEGLIAQLTGRRGRLFQYLPLLSAGLIVLIGVGITLQALWQTGVFNF